MARARSWSGLPITNWLACNKLRERLSRMRYRFPHAELQSEFRKLEQAAQKGFRTERWPGALHYEHNLDLRYRGQGYELNIPAGTEVSARFHPEHQRRYGYHHAGREIELVTLRLRVRMKAPKLNVGPNPQKIAGISSRRVPAVESAAVIFQSEVLATPVYERSELRPGKFLKGPAVIAEYSATTVIPAGNSFWLDRMENLLIDTGQRKAETHLAAASQQQ